MIDGTSVVETAGSVTTTEATFGIGIDELASGEAAIEETTRGSAVTVTVIYTVFGEETITVAGPHSIGIMAFAVLGDWSLLAPNLLIWLGDCVLLPTGGLTVLATSLFPPPRPFS